MKPDARSICRAARAAGILASIAFVSGCVTEKPDPPRGVSVSGSTQRPGVQPVFRGASGDTSVSRVQVQVLPIGSVEYDGMTLPLVSPDASHVVAQTGFAPSEGAMLGFAGATPPVGTYLTVSRLLLDENPPRLVSEGLLFSPPAGLMLGRACDREGFLVEKLNDDGTRWIGRIDWRGEGVQWLVQDDFCNAQATLTCEGDLVYCRRAVNADAWELVARSGGLESVVTPQLAVGSDRGGVVFPMGSSTPGLVYAMVISPSRGLEIAAFSMRQESDGRRRLAAVQGRARLSGAYALSSAFQASAPVQPALPCDGRAAPFEPFPVFHVGLGTMVQFEPRTGALSLLASKAYGAVRLRAVPTGDAPPGVFVSTSDGLVYVADKNLGGMSTPPKARVLETQAIVRATLNPNVPAVLFMPDVNRPSGLAVTLMTVVSDGTE